MNHLVSMFLIPIASAQNINPNEIANQTGGQLTSLVTFIVSQIPLWITSFIVVVITIVIARMVKGAVENKMAVEGIEEEHKEIAILAVRASNAVVLTVGITVALKIAGIDLTSIIAAAAFGVGFALRDIIMNFIAGVLLLSSRHYTIGDVIKVKGTRGRIVEIQTRATILKAFDGTKIIVPNAELFKNQVTSFTSNPFRRIELSAGVHYGEDLARTKKVIMRAVKNTKGVLVEPKPKMAFYEWGAYSINFKVKAWVESRGGWVKIRHNMLINIDTALKEAGIGIPFPIQVVQVEKNSQAEHEVEAMTQQALQLKDKAVVQGKPIESDQIKEQRVSKDVKSLVDQQPKSKVNTEEIDAPTWLKKVAKNDYVIKANLTTQTPPPEQAVEVESDISTPEPQPEVSNAIIVPAAAGENSGA